MKLFLPPLRVTLLLLAGLAVAGVLFLNRPGVRTEAADAPDQAAVGRARQTVKLLDTMHKGYVVHITNTYVKAQERIPAARVAKKVFKHVEENAGPPTRLLDATGEPVNEANVATSAFEKKAVAQIRKGRPYYEEVGSKEGKPVLRAATAVPAVMKQCVACHEHVKEGDVLGALVYEVPIK